MWTDPDEIDEDAMSARRGRQQIFVQCVPGLERLLESELAALGLRTGRRVRGGVEGEASTRQLYLANHASRLATRVLVRVAHFTAESFGALERGVERVAWDRYIDRQRVVVRAASTASALFHTDAIAERVQRAVTAGSDRHLDPQRVHVRLRQDRVTISVDSSGEALHHRGWRDGKAKAPLRSTVAAAMLAAVGFDGGGPVIDPFCGSGTIAIEAARVAAGLGPRVDRAYAFQQWPCFEPGTWASVDAAAVARAAPSVTATDRDAGAVATTVANAARAGVTLRTACRSLSDLEPPGEGPGWLVTNAPYGKRVRADDLRNLYARLGDVARDRLPGWQVAILTNDMVAAGHAGLGLESVLATSNGGIAVDLLAGTVPAAE